MKRLSKQIHRVIQDYADAEVNSSWKGSRSPEEFPEIDAQMLKATTAKDELVKKIVSALIKHGVTKL